MNKECPKCKNPHIYWDGVYWKDTLLGGPVNYCGNCGLKLPYPPLVG